MQKNRSLAYALTLLLGVPWPAAAQNTPRFAKVEITSTASDALKVGTASLGDSDLAKIDGITNGTAAAGKALVADSNRDVSNVRNIGVASLSASTFGPLPSSGAIRLGYSTYVYARNFGDSADVLLLGLNSSNQVVVGTTGYHVIPGGSSNSSDLGESASRWKDLYIQGVLNVGSAALDVTDLAKIDGVTNGTAAASKALVTDANSAVNILRTASLRLGASGSETTVTSTGVELNYLAGITCGTVTASKALCVDSNKDLATLRNLTASGNVAIGSNPAAAGSVRLANNSSINWRNAANSADLGITLDGSNVLQVGAPIVGNVSVEFAGNAFIRNAVGIGGTYTGTGGGGPNGYIYSPAATQFNFLNGATTLGVGLDFGTDGVGKVRNRAQNADADWTAANFKASASYTSDRGDGTVLSNAPQTIAQDAIIFLGSGLVGYVAVINVSSSVSGLIDVGGGTASVVRDSSGNFSVTKDTANKINVYFDGSGGSGSGYYLQNKIAASRIVRIVRLGL